MNVERRAGLAYLEAATRLLQRIYLANPAAALYGAAELQFWWSRPRTTDEFDQLFWFDDAGEPVAAAILVDFTDGSSLVYDAVTFCPFTLPDASPEMIGLVLDSGRELAAEHGWSEVELEVERNNTVMQTLLGERGFCIKAEHVLMECRLDPATRVEVSPLADGYHLTTRADVTGQPHHMTGPTPEFETRLRQGSLYRSDLDLVVVDSQGDPAAYGMFWYDPVTASGVVEPMRTHDDHQQRGLARHILTAGVEHLAQAGATSISIGYEPDNPASGHLYRDVGFVPSSDIDLYSGPCPAEALTCG